MLGRGKKDKKKVEVKVEANPGEPEVKPSEPEVNPVAPEVVPNGPEVKPGNPEVVPNGPEAKPGNPEVVPNGPEAKPVSPEVKPDMHEMKIAELTNDLQRVRADFENYRKQIEMQKLAEKKMARYATVSKVLPLLDDIDRAILTYEELKPLAKSLEKTMKELGLSKIAIEKGSEFNPELAEAVMAEGDGEKEVVSEVLRPGYYYEKEVLRPAMVKVQKI